MALRSNRAAVNQKLRETVEDRLQKSGLIVSNQAKIFSPVDTGRLRSSLTYEVEGDTVYIGTNVKYGVYQELGTRRMQAQPFLVPGINAARPALVALWKKPAE